MAKKVDVSVLDALLDEVIDNATRVLITDGEPATYAAATTDPLAADSVTSGDFTKAAGAGDNGRRYTFAGKSGVDVDNTGTADHACLVDDTNDVLLVVTTISNSQTITQGNQVDIGEFDHTIQDPT